MKIMKNTYIVLIAAVILIIAILAAFLLYSFFNSNSTVQKGDTVSVFYTGSFTNGTVFNSNVGQQPFTFVAGSNNTIIGFDNAVLGMSLNQSKTVTIPSNEAYGPINNSRIITVPLSDFQNKTVKIGTVVSTSNTGQGSTGVVIGVTNTSAIVNFNSPLASQTLIFTIKVVNITK